MSGELLVFKVQLSFQLSLRYLTVFDLGFVQGTGGFEKPLVFGNEFFFLAQKLFLLGNDLLLMRVYFLCFLPFPHVFYKLVTSAEECPKNGVFTSPLLTYYGTWAVMLNTVDFSSHLGHVS